MVHSRPDKFTQPDGAAGERMAIGVIGLANPNIPEFRQTRMEGKDNVQVSRNQVVMARAAPIVTGFASQRIIWQALG